FVVLCISLISYYFRCCCRLSLLHSFPTRRSSDLVAMLQEESSRLEALVDAGIALAAESNLDILLSRIADLARQVVRAAYGAVGVDRKSTRLNSSHQIISYAVFRLKKKNIEHKQQA